MHAATSVKLAGQTGQGAVLCLAIGPSLVGVDVDEVPTCRSGRSRAVTISPRREGPQNSAILVLTARQVRCVVFVYREVPVVTVPFRHVLAYQK